MTFYIYTLGCKVNSYESNVMRELLIKDGFLETTDIADIYIINSCTVTHKADSKTLNLIKKARSKNKEAIIIVSGCLPQVNLEKVLKLKDVDIIIGNNNKTKITTYLKEFINKKKQIVDIKNLTNVKYEKMNLNTFDKTRAFVKIQDGCDNYCSYCIIPYTRGVPRSRLPNEVIDEINLLVKKGFNEIVLTGINTGSYGQDLENYSFSKLLEEITKNKNLKRLRISSIGIANLNEAFLKVLKNNNVIVNHLHISLQSGSDEILKKMNRKYTSAEYLNKIKEIRKVRPNMLITTDVIVGFPGETEKFFLETVEFLKKVNFFKLHVFPYSKRKGTSAALMKEQINSVIKKERVKRLLKLSKQHELKTMKRFLNKTIDFIPEVEKNGYLIGHSNNYLLIKIKNNNYKLNSNLVVKIKEIKYPYCIGIIEK